ncbi:hypothetical protein H4582DRAFT_1179293 [Lactarius indigo]|nr:hypothetical protein H4582DRAFT_1179293 [Lactarius indigo]
MGPPFGKVSPPLLCIVACTGAWALNDEITPADLPTHIILQVRRERFNFFFPQGGPFQFRVRASVTADMTDMNPSMNLASGNLHMGPRLKRVVMPYILVQLVLLTNYSCMPLKFYPGVPTLLLCLGLFYFSSELNENSTPA